MKQKPDMFAQPEQHEEWVIQQAVERMRSEANRQQHNSERDAAGAFEDTEAEVYQSVFPEAYDPYEQQLDIDDLSQVEGADGRPLSDIEIAARNLYGDDAIDGNLTDRPLEVSEELSALDLVRQRDQQLAAKDAQLRDLSNRYDPQIRAQTDAAKQAFWEQHGLMPLDERADALGTKMAQEASRRAQLDDMRVKQSIESQRAEFGDRFVDDAINKFMRIDQNAPIAQAINQHVYASDDPGRTFLELVSESGVVNSMGRNQHPFARRGAAPAPANRSRQSWPGEDDNHNSGYGDQSTENAIWDDVWRK